MIKVDALERNNYYLLIYPEKMVVVRTTNINMMWVKAEILIASPPSPVKQNLFVIKPQNPSTREAFLLSKDEVDIYNIIL